MMKMWKLIGILSAVALVALIGIGIYNSRTGYVIEDGIRLPSFALKSQKIKAAYIYAVLHPEDLDGVPCYCGCMQHPHGGRIHKRGLLDCFIKDDGSFDRHGSECDMCINDALDVQRRKG